MFSACNLPFNHVKFRGAVPTGCRCEQRNGIWAPDVVMASGFCERCSRLLKQIATWLRRFCRGVEQRVREVFRELCQCGCFRSAPEKRLLRRMTEELTPVRLLGKGTATIDFHCLWTPIMWTIKHIERLPLLF